MQLINLFIYVISDLFIFTFATHMRVLNAWGTRDKGKYCTLLDKTMHAKQGEEITQMQKITNKDVPRVHADKLWWILYWLHHKTGW
jgi:hypothetical protein